MKYVSELKELAGRQFDTVAACEAAEKEIAKKQKEKEVQAKAKKADAVKVEDAFKELNLEKKVYNKAIVEARKVYNEALVAAGEAYDAAVESAHKSLTTAQKRYDSALDDFTKKHPEGYHMTLRDGDNVTTISKSNNELVDESRGFKALSDLFDSVFNYWL